MYIGKLTIFFIIILVFYIFVRQSCRITRSSTCLIGKTAIVTGANSGIGYYTVLNLASRGCRVIMADIADMHESKKNVIKFTNNSNIITKKLDLSSLQSVRDFATDVQNTEKRIDILINNAGIFASKNIRTEDRLNPIMQVNFFGHFLLTYLLIDLLKKSSPSRILFTSSLATYSNTLSSENLNSPNTCKSWSESYYSYSNSKTAMMIASDAFAKKLNGTGVTSNAVHPGFVATPLYQQGYDVHNSIPIRIFMSLRWIFGKSAWEGSQSLVHAAVSKKLENTSGKFLVDGFSFRKPSCVYDEKFCQEMWDAFEKIVKLQPPDKNLISNVN